MKKILFSLLACVCVVLAVAVILPGTTVSAAASESALLGASLYLDDQADVIFCFDPEVIKTRTEGGENFTFTTSFGEETLNFTEEDLELMQDPATGAVYQTITLENFSAVELNKVITCTGSMIKKSSFTLSGLAKSGVDYYTNKDYVDTKKYENMADMLKAFANYAVAADNYANKKNQSLPYNLPLVNSNEGKAAEDQFVADGGEATPLATGNVLTGRNFFLEDGVYLQYNGNIPTGSNTATWSVSVNSQLIPDAITNNGDGTFTAKIPISAELGSTGLRIIIRDTSNTSDDIKYSGETLHAFGGKILFDCIDKADLIAYSLATSETEDLKKCNQLGNALTTYLQKVSAYSKNPTVDNPIVTKANDKGAFYAGFSKVDISAHYKVTLLNTRTRDGKTANYYSYEFMDPIYATCVALQDANGKLALIYSIDVRNIQSGDIYNKMKNDVISAVKAATGYTLTAEQIYFNATHNHNAPNVTADLSTYPEIKYWYNNHFYPAMPEAAVKAIQDLTEVEAAYTGSADTASGTNFNRRYIYGTYNRVTGFEDGADKNMRTVRFARKDKAKDIILVNWQGHVANAANLDKGTADFIGALRKNVETELDAHFLYINGASGDLNMTGHSNLETSPYQHSINSLTYCNFTAVGNDIFTTLKTAINGESAATLGAINTNIVSTNSKINGLSSNGITFTDGDYEGKLILRYRQHNNAFCLIPNSYQNYNCPDCHGMYLAMTASGAYNKGGEATWNGKTYTYIANTYKNAKEFTYARDQFSPYGFPKMQTEFTMNTLTIGNSIGFAFCPYEMFNQNGVDLRTAVGNDKMVFVGGYTNGYNSYIASIEAFNKVSNHDGVDDGANEVYATKYPRGCAEYFQRLLSNSLKDNFAKY